MVKVLKNVPEVVKGTLLMVAGISLLLHTLGVLTEFLWYALIIMSLMLLFAGFAKIGGVSVVKSFMQKDDTVVVEQEKE